MPDPDRMTELSEKQLRTHFISAVEIASVNGTHRPYACLWVAQAVFLRRCSDLVGSESEGTEHTPVVPEKARWAFLIGHARDEVGEAVHEAIRLIAAANPEFSEIIPFNTNDRSGFNDDQTLRRMLDHLDAQPLRDEDIESPRALGRAFDRVLVRGKLAGVPDQFVTPESVIQILARLANVSDGMSIYDPCAGTGGLLIGCALDAERRHRDLESLGLHGQDRLPKSVSLSKMTAFLHGLHVDVRVGDTLAEPLHLTGSEVDRFDCVISVPPIGEKCSYGSLPIASRFPLGTSGPHSDVMFLQRIQAFLAPEGRAIVLVRVGLLSLPGRERELRRLLIDEDAIEAVVLLGPDLLESTNLSTAVLVLRSADADAGERKGRVIFIDGRNGAHRRAADGDTQGTTLDAIVSAHRGFRAEKGFSAVVDVSRIRERGYDLEVTWYSGEAEKRLQKFLVTHKGQPLGSMAEVKTGHARRQRSGGKPKDSGMPFVQARDLGDKVELEQLEVDELRSDRDRLEPWDILVGAFGNRISSAFVVAPYLADLAVQPASDLIRVRLHDATEERSKFVAAYLRSDVGQSWVRATQRGGALPRITATGLASTPVPAFDRSVAQMSDHVRRVTGRLRELAEEYEHGFGRVFASPDSVEQLMLVQKPLAQVEAVDQFISTVGTLSSIVRTAFPLPLALGWRRYEMTLSPGKRYQAILKLSENVTAYLAILLVADVRAKGGWRSKVGRPLLGKLKPGGRMTFGTWGAVLETAAGRPDRQVQGTRIPELWESIVEGGPLLAALNALSTRRNDESHQTGPSAVEIQVELPIAEDELRRVFEALLFLCRYPLRKIEGTKHDPLAEETTATYRELRGDHEVVRPQTIPTAIDLGESLYLIGRGDEPISLDPWLVFQECPTCSHPELYVPNKGHSDGGEYRSLTTNHCVKVGVGAWSRLSEYLAPGPAAGRAAKGKRQ